MAKKKDGKQQKQAPFFARYLEGQEELTTASSATVAGPNQLAYKKSAASKKSVAAPKATLKYPSDRDELHFVPYYQTAEAAPVEGGGGGAVTLKYPSDNDEYAYNASYVSIKDVPKSEKAKPKETQISLKKSKKKW